MSQYLGVGFRREIQLIEIEIFVEGKTANTK